MKLFDQVLDQSQAIGYLKKVLEDGRISHAYLFLGPEGVGKSFVANFFAAALLCKSSGCASCEVCSRVLKKIHPDVIYIEPEGSFITIPQIREVRGEVKLKPYEAERKIIIIDGACQMNAEAANALLKVLEEPPPYVVFILIATTLEKVFPTVSSRCEIIRFRRISRRNLVKFLEERFSVSKKEAEQAVKLSEGVLSQAIDCVKKNNYKEIRRKFLELIENSFAANALSGERVFEAFENSRFILEETARVLKELKLEQKKELEEVENSFLVPTQLTVVKKKLLARHKREQKISEIKVLSIFLSFLSKLCRDLLILRVTGDVELLYNLDLLEELKGVVLQISPLKVGKAIATVERTKEYILSNVGKELALENMFLNFGGGEEIKELNTLDFSL